MLIVHFQCEAAIRYQRPAASLTPEDLARWSAYAWPRNVRQLKNVADRWALGLPDGLAAAPLRAATGRESLTDQIDRAERGAIETALRLCEGSVAKAAENLRLLKKTLYDKLHRQGLEPDAYRGLMAK